MIGWLVLVVILGLVVWYVGLARRYARQWRVTIYEGRLEKSPYSYRSNRRRDEAWRLSRSDAAWAAAVWPVVWLSAWRDGRDVPRPDAG